MEKNEEMVEVKMLDIPSSAENTLKTIATIILICGIIVSFILFFTVAFIEEPSYSYHTKKAFNPEGFAMTVCVLLSSIATWASLNVFANISLRIKGIQETMPLRLVSKNEINTKGKNKNSGIQVGDKVTWKKTMTKYIVAEISDEEVYLNTGLLGGYKWVPKDEIIIPEK